MIPGDPSTLSDKDYIGRFCAIDIGTVTCRMLISDAYLSDDGTIHLVELDKEHEVVNLGEGVDSTHRLSKEALNRASCALQKFADTRLLYSTDERPIVGTMAVATSAARDAENSSEFVQVLANLGIRLDVIAGEQEAGLSFSGASCAYLGECVAVIDAGGGSTEISIGKAGETPIYSHSFDIGCRRITERFWDGYPCSAGRLKKARAQVAEAFADLERSVSCDIDRVIAVAGTATSVVSMHLGMKAYDASIVNGAEITFSELEGIEQALSLMELNSLEEVEGLNPRRAPVIVAGLIILEEALKVLHARAYTASESDILEGIVMYNASASIASR